MPVGTVESTSKVKKAISKAENPVSNAESGAAAKTTLRKTKPKKTSSTKIAEKKSPATTLESAATELSATQRVGLTAGDIWQYLNKNGVSTIASLLNELQEKDSIIQRGIDWLAQESKIHLDTSSRVETIALKE